jgi:NAD(P)-dependent dehydrogenase (short-subunit alcohol dehydrogenase family)
VAELNEFSLPERARFDPAQIAARRSDPILRRQRPEGNDLPMTLDRFVNLLAAVDDVGVAAAFLAHDAARLITGETLYVDGGYHIME